MQPENATIVHKIRVAIRMYLREHRGETLAPSPIQESKVEEKGAPRQDVGLTDVNRGKGGKSAKRFT